MNMAKYCKDKGMTKEQFLNFKANIKNTAIAILDYIKSMYITGNGLYHNTSEIFSNSSNKDTQSFIIKELKNIGVEFINNNTLWRY